MSLEHKDYFHKWIYLSKNIWIYLYICYTLWGRTLNCKCKCIMQNYPTVSAIIPKWLWNIKGTQNMQKYSKVCKIFLSLLWISLSLFLFSAHENSISYVRCRHHFGESRFKTKTMFCGQDTFLNPDLRWKPCSVVTIWNLDLAVSRVHWAFIL